MSEELKSCPLSAIGEQLRIQDNRITQNPMFCVQEHRLEFGYDYRYADDRCWYKSETDSTVFKRPKNTDGWEEFGYKHRWVTAHPPHPRAG